MEEGSEGSLRSEEGATLEESSTQRGKGAKGVKQL